MTDDGRTKKELIKELEQLFSQNKKLETSINECCLKLQEKTDQLKKEKDARRKAEKLLTDSEGKWRSFMVNAPDIIFTVDRDGKILFINKVPDGINVEDAIGTNAIDYVAPEYRETVRKAIQKVFETGCYESYEIRARGPYDKMSWYSTRLGPVKVKDEITSVMMITRDINDKREQQKAIIEIEERELQRIGHDLHDNLGQQLAGISYICSCLVNTLTSMNLPEAETADRIKKLVDDAKIQTRNLSRGLSPLMRNDEDSLKEALKELVSNTRNIFNVKCILNYKGPVAIHNKSAFLNLYRIIQEAVTNAVKHGKADSIEIYLDRENSNFVLRVKDNGTGITEPVKKTGMGLRIMKYRADLIGAYFDVKR